MEYLNLWVAIAFILIVLYYLRRHCIHKKQLKIIMNKIKSVTSPYRGTPSERDLILNLLDMNIPAKSIFHDLYLRKEDNSYSQIDIVVPTKVGILVFEVKDYAGWIYGNGNQSQWTKVLNYGRKKYHFYNPVQQNNHHIEELRKMLKEDVPFFSIIVFYGSSELKDISFIPPGTFITKWYKVDEIISGILRFNLPANYKNKENVIRILKNAVKNGQNKSLSIEHIENIKDMIGKNRIFS